MLDKKDRPKRDAREGPKTIGPVVANWQQLGFARFHETLVQR
jgi:hypothetical protein